MKFLAFSQTKLGNIARARVGEVSTIFCLGDAFREAKYVLQFRRKKGSPSEQTNC